MTKTYEQVISLWASEQCGIEVRDDYVVELYHWTNSGTCGYGTCDYSTDELDISVSTEGRRVGSKHLSDYDFGEVVKSLVEAAL